MAIIDLHEGDCLDVLATLEDCTFDSVITDPPAGISFMGKSWDSDRGGADQWIDWLSDIMKECLRLTKPGGTLLCWAIPRTSHWTGMAIERAGWEVRDVVTHVFGSGFPKSHQFSKSMNGDGEAWRGHGTALKPAVEFWWLAQRPLDGTYAHNALTHGVAGLNVDGARVGTEERTQLEAGYIRRGRTDEEVFSTGYGRPKEQHQTTKGRWPANLILDGSEQVVRLFPVTTSGKPNGAKRNVSGPFLAHANGVDLTGYGDSGSAARFFYCAKSSSRERSAGLDGDKNTHPTCKPLNLLRYLAKLTRTPTGGKVLDPFMGSGTTGAACVLEGRDFVGIDKEAEYVEIARRRIAYWAEQAEREAVQPMLFDKAAD